MRGRKRTHLNGSTSTMSTGGFSSVIRLENVPRLVEPQIEDGYYSHLSARWSYSEDGSYEVFGGFCVHVYGGWSSPDLPELNEDRDIEPANRHSFNVQHYADGSMGYPGRRFMLHYSEMMGGWYLTA